jgi:excisionase family DNA binding protein
VLRVTLPSSSQLLRQIGSTELPFIHFSVSASKEMISMNPVASTAAPCGPAESGTTLPTYLSPSQLADLLGVHRSTISRLAASDPSMPAIRLGGVVRFRLDRVEAWLESRTQGAPRAQRRQRSA